MVQAGFLKAFARGVNGLFRDPYLCKRFGAHSRFRPEMITTGIYVWGTVLLFIVPCSHIYTRDCTVYHRSGVLIRYFLFDSVRIWPQAG